MSNLLRTIFLGLVLVLSGCALMPERLAPGTPRADIVQRLGTPTGEYPLPDGTRLQYSRQPAGQQVYNLDLDAQGRLRRVEQVLDIHWMQKNIAIDRWQRDDVLRAMGRPARVERVARFDGDIWTYRFLELDLPRQAHLHLDPQGVLRKLVFTDEPRGVEFPPPL
jgi:hypothetical protein